MERVTFYVEELHPGFLDPDALLVASLVEGAFHFQAALGGCRTDQFDDRHAAFQGLPAPILRDVAEHPVPGLFHFDVPGG